MRLFLLLLLLLVGSAFAQDVPQREDKCSLSLMVRALWLADKLLTEDPPLPPPIGPTTPGIPPSAPPSLLPCEEEYRRAFVENRSDYLSFDPCQTRDLGNGCFSFPRGFRDFDIRRDCGNGKACAMVDHPPGIYCWNDQTKQLELPAKGARPGRPSTGMPSRPARQAELAEFQRISLICGTHPERPPR